MFCGNAFAVRRDIWKKVGGYSMKLLEDCDFITKVYKVGGSYHLLEDICITMGYPKTFQKLIDQRKRWFIGFLEYLYDNRKTIFQFFKEYPFQMGMFLAFIFFLLYI